MCNGFQCLCRCFMEYQTAFLLCLVCVLILCPAVCFINWFCLLVGGNVLSSAPPCLQDVSLRLFNASAVFSFSALISSIRLTKSAYCSILCSVKKFMVFAASFRLWIFAHCSYPRLSCALILFSMSISNDTPRCSFGAFAAFVRLPAIRSLIASSV